LKRFQPGAGSARHVGIIVVAALIGYLGAGLGLNQPTLAAVAPTPTVPPTPTVARAVTFTPTVFTAETPTEEPQPSAVAAQPTTVPKTTPTTTPKPTSKPTGAPVYYLVQSGDTIEGISNKFGVGEDAIIRANSLADPNQLSVGEKLVIPR